MPSLSILPVSRTCWEDLEGVMRTICYIVQELCYTVPGSQRGNQSTFHLLNAEQHCNIEEQIIL